MTAGAPLAADLSKVDHFSRLQGLSIRDMFPVRTDGLCACGCGKRLAGRRSHKDKTARGTARRAASRRGQEELFTQEAS